MVDQILGFVLYALGSTQNVLGIDEEKVETRQELQKEREKIREEAKQEREEAREAMKTAREEKREEIKTAKSEMKEARKELIASNRASLKEEIEEKRQEAKEKFEAAREEFQEKLSTIRDTKKKALVALIDDKFQKINDHRLDQMTKHIDKIAQILDKVIARATKAKDAGKDTSAVDAVIARCETAITDARTAVSTQAENEYVIELSDASASGALRRTVGATRQDLQSDLKVVQDKIVIARKCVSDALKALAKITGNKGFIDGSPSPSVTATPTATVTGTPSATLTPTETETPTPTPTL